MQKYLFAVAISGLILGSNSCFAHRCELRLNPQKVREIVVTQAGSPLNFMGLQGTPLEVSSYLRNWKRDLAEKLEISPQDIEGNFSRNLSTLEEDSRSDELRLLIVKTATGLRTIVVVELDLKHHKLSYFHPQIPSRAWLSGISEINGGGRRTLHISAFEDQFDRSGTSGNVLGIMSVRLPGFNLSG